VFRIDENPSFSFTVPTSNTYEYKETIACPFTIFPTPATASSQQFIIQTEETAQVPYILWNAARSIVDKNPDSEYLFFDAEMRREFIKTHFSPKVLAAYDSLNLGAFRADIFRLCALYQLGGIYLDLKKIAQVPFSAEDKPLFCVDRPGHMIYNSVIAAPAQSPVIFYVLDGIATNVLEKRVARNCLDMTGPMAIGRLLNRLLGRDADAEFEMRDYGPFKVALRWRSGDDFVTDAKGAPVFVNQPSNYYQVMEVFRKGAYYCDLYYANQIFSSAALGYPSARFSVVPHAYNDVFEFATLEGGSGLRVTRTDQQSPWAMYLRVNDHQTGTIVEVGQCLHGFQKVVALACR